MERAEVVHPAAIGGTSPTDEESVYPGTSHCSVPGLQTNSIVGLVRLGSIRRVTLGTC